MTRTSRLAPHIAIFCFGLILAGCGRTGLLGQRDIHAHLQRADYAGLAARYATPSGEPAYDPGNLLDLLIAAKAFHDAGLWQQSNDAFVRAERHLLWKADSIDTPREVVQILAQTIVNETVSKYRGKVFEGVMINYYQALNALMLGDEDDARVFFNRLAERQDNAEVQFEAFASFSAQKAREADKQTTHHAVDGKILAQTRKRARQGALRHLPARKTPISARSTAADVMAAIFRQTSSIASDRQHLPGLRNRLNAATSPEGAGEAGERLVDALFADHEKGRVVVVYEDGIGPHLKEQRIEIQLSPYYHDVTYAGMALPVFIPGKSAFRRPTLLAGDSAYPIIPLTSIDTMAAREFLAGYDALVARSILSAFLKILGQQAINSALDNNKDDNHVSKQFIKILTGVFTQVVLTRADTRAWVNLPRSIGFAVFARPEYGVLTLASSEYGRERLRIPLPKAPENATILVLLRASHTSGPPVAYVRVLPGPAPAQKTPAATDLRFP